MKTLEIPEKALSKDEILGKMKQMSNEDVKWHEGKAFGYVYHIDDEHSDFIKKCHNKFASTNALSPLAFPSLKRFESEIVSMTASMLGGDDEVVGNVTSCGTESILVALKTYRDWGNKKIKTDNPEIILPRSAHPAFDKGAHYFGLKIIHVDIRDDYRADPDAMQDAITDDTVMMMGSACDYPKGVVDPIEELAEIAQDHKIGFHVDSCLGGFMLPWLKKLGYPIPNFDLSVEGVTSISADCHKYGFGFKGSSTILFKDEDFQKYQYFATTEWPGGIYASPTMTGTRPGGVIAGTWAAMKSLGQDGYMKVAEKTMKTTQKLMNAVKSIPELHVFGEPDMTVFTFGSDDLNVYRLADLMQARGWILDKLQKPRCLHCIVNPNQFEVTDEFKTDLTACVEELRDNPRAKTEDGTAAMYGMMEKLPLRKLVKKKVIDFMIDQYKLDED